MVVPSIIGDSPDLVFRDTPNMLSNGFIGLKLMLTDLPKDMVTLTVIDSLGTTRTRKRFWSMVVFIAFDSFLCSSLGNTSNLLNFAVWSN